MRIATAACAVVAVLAVAVAWLQNPGSITAGEAVRAAEEAFASAGLSGAEVLPDAEAGRHDGAGGRAVEVWKTEADLDGGRVELWLARADGASVYLDDRAPDGTSRLLTDAQFRRLDAHHENPAVDRHVRRNRWLTLAAALVLGLVALLLRAVPEARIPPDDLTALRHALRRADTPKET